jgi:outer membrane protein assembly factor BamB
LPSILVNKPIAKYRYGTEFGTSPNLIVSDGHCYIYTDARKPELLCLRLSDFSEVWRRPSEPLLGLTRGNNVLLAWAGRSCSLVCINEDGRELWRRPSYTYWKPWRDRVMVGGDSVEVIDQASGGLLYSIVPTFPPTFTSLAGNVALVHGDKGWVAAYDLDRNEMLWSRSLEPVFDQAGPEREGELGGRYVSEDGAVIVCSPRRHLFAFSVTTGEFLWKLPLVLSSPMAVTHDRIYARHRRQSSAPLQLICLELTTGTVLFERDLSQFGEKYNRDYFTRAPVIDRDVMLLSFNEPIALFSTRDGELLWEFQRLRGISDPQFVDDKLFVTTGDGYLLVLEAAPKRKRQISAD